MIVETIESLLKKQFAFNYIAIVAIAVPIITYQYLVGAHYSTDVLAGIVIGFLVAKVSLKISNPIRKF